MKTAVQAGIFGQSRSSAWSWPAVASSVATATLVSGTLDAAAGIVVFDFIQGKMGILQILQWIASGVFGERAFSMGLVGAGYGLLFHYIVALGFSAGLFAVYKRFKVLADYPVFSGLAYGGYIWVAMNFWVLPHSKTVVGEFSPSTALIGFIWHMVLVGLPIVLIARRHFEEKSV